MSTYTKEMFVKNKFDGYITNGWDIVTSSSIFKDEFKSDEAEKEIILGYANALNCIANSLLEQNHSETIVMTIRINSLTIPFIFLARHTVELTLKYLCRILNIEFPNKHRLMTLWNKITAKFKEYDLIQDNAMEDITIFISVMEELDCDGSHSRYSKNVNGELYNKEPKFINVKEINYFIQNLFVKLINSIKVA